MSGGDPEVLVQMAVFRMKPWEHEACDRLPTAAERASYKQWIDRFAAGRSAAQHTAIILQPDGPFALCAPGGSKVPSHLIGYAARTFTALPHTSVYIDAGAADWPSDDPAKAREDPDARRHRHGPRLRAELDPLRLDRQRDRLRRRDRAGAGPPRLRRASTS